MTHRRLERLEHLMSRRPELLSSVMLRQNPHNVHEWHKRARLFANHPHKQILTYTEAVKTVDPDKVGAFAIWVLLAMFNTHSPGCRSLRSAGKTDTTVRRLVHALRIHSCITSLRKPQQA